MPCCVDTPRPIESHMLPRRFGAIVRTTPRGDDCDNAPRCRMRCVPPLLGGATRRQRPSRALPCCINAPLSLGGAPHYQNYERAWPLPGVGKNPLSRRKSWKRTNEPAVIHRSSFSLPRSDYTPRGVQRVPPYSPFRAAISSNKQIYGPLLLESLTVMIILISVLLQWANFPQYLLVHLINL
jgi:hypothetical protein